MSMIENIASISMAMSSMNVASQVSLSVLKNAMEQSSENMLEILEMPQIATMSESIIDISI